MFEEFHITRSGDRIIVEPKLMAEFVPEGRWRTLDFGDDDQGGELTVEVVEHLGAVMKKVDLTRAFERDNPSDSS